jgi:hypothetical protein
MHFLWLLKKTFRYSLGDALTMTYSNYYFWRTNITIHVNRISMNPSGYQKTALHFSGYMLIYHWCPVIPKDIDGEQIVGMLALHSDISTPHPRKTCASRSRTVLLAV